MDSFEVDVIIPVFNGERYIQAAIESVANQSSLPHSVIVVNDGSTDHTLESLTALQKKTWPFDFKVINKKNGGPNSARNLGLQNSSAPYLAFLDADDVWESQKLAVQMQIFREAKYQNIKKGLGVVYCDYSNIGPDGKFLPYFSSCPLDPSVRGDCSLRLFAGNLISSSASGVLIRRECFDRVGLFDETLRVAEDWDMWLRIAQFYAYDFSPEKLVRLRRHASNASNDRSNLFWGDLKMLWKNRVLNPPAVSARIHREITRAPDLKTFQELFKNPARYSLEAMVNTEFATRSSRGWARAKFLSRNLLKMGYRTLKGLKQK